MTKANSARLLPVPGEVVVRMYRAGLGDCFLLAFGREDGTPAYVLIDCGIHMRQDKGPARLMRVMQDIRAATGGHLDVVVATHEHADHMSGFVQKDGPFSTAVEKDRITFDQFWVAWTEKEDKGLADKLRARRGAHRAAIRKAVEKLEERAEARTGDGLDDLGFGAQAKELIGLGDFEDMDPETLSDEILAAVADGNKKKVKDKNKPSSNEVALELLKLHAGKPVYLEPGDVAPVPGVPWTRAYVLGPPKDETMLKKDSPTGGDEGENRETYLTGRGELTALRLAPALGLDSTLHDDYRHPFDKTHRCKLPGISPADDDPAALALRTSSTEAADFWADHYTAEDKSWRRIDSDWLGAAEHLALDLESDTNNTSLVLAFELGDPGRGKVLLFVGDAQVGNWISWHDLPFTVKGKKSTADDLLKRTALYKVGHHGSHNATVKRVSATDPSPFGLELMPSGLIAMIPVDRAAAQRKMPNPWKMPHQPLYERLLQKSNGRVLRSDGEDPWWPNPPAQTEPPGSEFTDVPGVTGTRWRKATESFATDEGRECPIFYEVAFASGD